MRSRAMRIFSRVLLLLLLAGMAGGIVYFRSGAAPFTAVASGSMVPILHRGDLVWIKPVDATTVQVGDIVVVAVPDYLQSRYNYPPTVIHRIDKVDTTTGRPLYRIKGDHNDGEDPFTVLPEYIRGQAAGEIRYAGYPILFLASRQGMLFLLVSILLYLVYSLLAWMERRRIGARSIVSAALRPAITDVATGVSASMASALAAALRDEIAPLMRRGGNEPQQADDGEVARALRSFALAMEEYAQHLASHTAVVQGLADTAVELRESVRFQLRMLQELEVRPGRVSAVREALPAPHCTRRERKRAGQRGAGTKRPSGKRMPDV